MPPLYERWLGSLLGGLPPRETRATCSNCAMCVPGASGVVEAVRPFNPAVKCCTYMPVLPNFLVGAALVDPLIATDGRRSLEDRIQRRSNVSPLGLGRSPLYDVSYSVASESSFGVAVGLTCPHYSAADGGSCLIWQHRNATCSTWFCKHVRGRIGYAMWRDVEAVLARVEAALAIWTCAETGLEGNQIRRLLQFGRATPQQLLAAELSGEWLESYEELWGQWVDRERDFYVECARLVQPLSWANVVEIAGPEVRAAAGAALGSFRELSAEPGKAGRVNSRLTVVPRGDVALVVGYSMHDPIPLPWGRLPILAEQAGTPINRAESVGDLGPSFEPEAIARMQDFGIFERS